MTITLWHFRYSHYNEKARWALDWKQLPHERRALAPGPHAPTMVEVSGQRAVPVVRIDDRVIPDTTAIIAALEALQPTPPLYPAEPAARARALALEERFDEALGPDVRRVFFHRILDDAAFFTTLYSEGIEPNPRPFYEASFPMLREVMRREMSIDDDTAARSLDVIDAFFDEIHAERAGRQHLVGDAFSVADLTAAALLSPIVTPPEFPYRLPPNPPAGVVALHARWASHPTFEWVRDIYRRYRGTSAERSA